MPSGRRSRILRKAKTAELGSERVEALSAAQRTLDKTLRELRLKYGPRIDKLEAEYAEARRKAWLEYDEKRGLIGRATLLKAKAPAG